MVLDPSAKRPHEGMSLDERRALVAAAAMARLASSEI
jgi:hypothetical protein